jgi:polar amino acid transport system substrate-binding protein
MRTPLRLRYIIAMRMRPAALASVLGLLLCACATPTLRVGTAADYAPLAFEQGRQLRGVEIDFAERVARELGRPLRLDRYRFEELIPALRDGRIDVIMTGMSITEDRSRLVRFTQPYLQVGQMALIRADEWDRRRGIEAMNRPESRVGFRPATTSDAFVRTRLPRARAVGFDSVEAGIASLRAGEIDYFVHDAPTIWRIVGGFRSDERQLTGLYEPLTDEYLAWAVRLEDTALAARLDAILAAWRRDGVVDEILDVWIPVRKIERPAPASR